MSAATARASRRAAAYVGASAAYDASANCLGELDERPGVLRCDIDVDAVRAARSPLRPVTTGLVTHCMGVSQSRPRGLQSRLGVEARAPEPAHSAIGVLAE